MTMLKLHEYQKRAVKHLHDNPRAALFLDMGLGKSATVLSAMTPDHLPALVVAPKRVAEHVWPAERDKWRPDLRMSLVVGSPKQRAAAMAEDADIYVIGQDNLGDITDHGFRTVVIDESSGFKSVSSVRFKRARQITKGVPHVWLLTGTPSPNGLMDLWSQVYLLDRGDRLGSGITKYRSRYFSPGWTLPNGIVAEWRLRPGAEARIHGLISDICLHMSAADHLDLPPVTVNDITVPLPPKASRVYADLRRDLVAQVDMLGTIHTAANAAVLSGKLSQVTAGHLYSDARDGSYSPLHMGKLDALSEVVEGTGSPVLVFYRFTAERDRILARHDHARTVDDKGALDAWNRGEVPLLLAHPASAGHGLNLAAGGHTIVWTTLPWSLELYEQSNARLARQGQTEPVVVHRLLCPDTVDGAVVDALDGKATVQNALLNHLKKETSCV